VLILHGVIGGRPLLAVFGGHPIRVVAGSRKRGVGSHEGGKELELTENNFDSDDCSRPTR